MFLVTLVASVFYGAIVAVHDDRGLMVVVGGLSSISMIYFSFQVLIKTKAIKEISLIVTLLMVPGVISSLWFVSEGLEIFGWIKYSIHKQK